MTRRCLALYLDGPLQSWGNQSRFDRRTSLPYPTRSGILGMLCAAMGIDWCDDSALSRLESGLALTVVSFGAPSMMVDYHTVGGGYEKSTCPQKPVPKADGGTGDTVVTRREYLQDARFGVLLGGDPPLLEEIAAALGDPRWGIWLGRKSCVPASPVPQGLFDTEEAALAHLQRLAGRPPTRKVTEVVRFDDGTDTLRDRPVSFGGREFKPRRIADEPL